MNENYNVGSSWSRKGNTGQEDCREVRDSSHFHGRYFPRQHQGRHGAGHEGRRSIWDQGRLVPDEITIGMLLDRIHEEDCKNGYVLDGFPRTIPQAESLTKALEEMGESIDYAVNVDVPDSAIVSRMSGRRACVNCGATYHIQYNPPKKEGVCDVCGDKLILRDDDKPETVQNRLSVYHEQTQPLIDYYKKAGVLAEVDGTQDMDKVFADITAVLGA